MRMPFSNYSGLVSLLLLLLSTSSRVVQGGAFVGKGAHVPLHQSWANRHQLDHSAPALFSSIHLPDSGDDFLFLNVETEERTQQQGAIPSLSFPVLPAVVSAVLFAIVMAAASGQDAALDIVDSQTDYPSSSVRTRQDTSILQQQRQAQPAVEEDQVVWMVDGSDGFFFF